MGKQITVAELMKEKQSEILDAWIEVIDRESGAGAARQTDTLMSSEELRSEAKSVLDTLTLAFASEDYDDLDAPQFEPALVRLREISASRTTQGFSPTETAMFVMSLKSALLQFMQKAFAGDPAHLNKETVKMNVIIDRLAMVTFETYVATRENVIVEQSRSLLELSTPVTSSTATCA